MSEETTKAGEVEVPEEVAKMNVVSISAMESNLKKALDRLFANTFGNQANKKIYALQKELIPYMEEYSYLRNKIGNDPKNVKGPILNELGMEELENLNQTIGMKEIDVKCELPIKLAFLDCFASNDRVLLETFGIVKFED